MDSVVIKHIIMQHQARVIASNNDEDVQCVRVRRSNILSDSVRQFSRKSFDVSRMIKVNFIGEEAVDLGGPRRVFPFADAGNFSVAVFCRVSRPCDTTTQC